MSNSQFNPEIQKFLSGISSNLKDTREIGNVLRDIKKNKELFEKQGVGVQITYDGKIEKII